MEGKSFHTFFLYLNMTSFTFTADETDLRITRDVVGTETRACLVTSVRVCAFDFMHIRAVNHP